MNSQSSKEIFFDKSILLSLKAELLKKKEEAQEKKHLPQHNVQNYKPPKHNNDKKNKSDNKITFKDKLKAVDTEELEACRKSKLALEKKAELYKHLSDGIGESELAGRFLVDFKQKKQEDITTIAQPEPVQQEKEEWGEEDDSEWIEFTDFLGRTRKCLKTDLDYYKKRDHELKKMVTDEPHNEKSNEEVIPEPEKPLLVQKTNDYLQSLREKWEEKERELLAKDKDVHYQDLLFDEARIHGVSYFSFSTDETERKKQMEELAKQRKETLKAQEQAEKLRKERDDMIAARVAAARARQRMRAGLPPEDPEEKKKDFTTCLLQFLTQQKNEADKQAKEEEEKAKKIKEEERKKLRETYVREWDLGKDGVEGKVKKFREMSQEEYVEQQRDKRINEFAPPQTSNYNKSNYSFNTEGKKVESDNRNKSWSDVRPVATPPAPNIGDIGEDAQKGLYFSTKRAETVVKYKNFVKAQTQTPIVNEIGDEEEEDSIERVCEPNVNSDHAEIAPPPTYEYYGPQQKYRKTNQPFTSDIREAMDQGIKSLEAKESNRILPKQYDFTFD